jgi:hypothetical protein
MHFKSVRNPQPVLLMFRLISLTYVLTAPCARGCRSFFSSDKVKETGVLLDSREGFGKLHFG